MKMIDLSLVLTQVLEWTKVLGAYQLEHQKSDELQVELKSSAIDLVTEVDRFSDNFLVEKIKNAYPEHNLLTEEGGIHTGSSDYLWIIDPLDGTTNYAHGMLIFAISIALLYKQEPVLAVVAVPGLRQNFTAIKGQGAFLNGRPIHVGRRQNLKESLVATGFPYDLAEHPDNNVAYAAHILLKVRGLRRLGSAAYDLACVAQGVYDAYWEPNLKPWDVAAGKLLVTEAGGVVRPWKGKRGESVLAGNAVICSVLEKELDKVKF